MYFEKLSKLLDGEKMKSAKNKKQTRIIFASLMIVSLLLLTISSSIQINAAYPKQRLGHRMIYDSVNDRIIMYGGYIGSGEANWVFDTWAYDYNTNEWTQLITDDVPYGTFASLAYDSESEKIISFGGSHADHVPSDQTWIYDYTENTWTQVLPSIVPNMRESTLMVYDSESDVVIMFGGSLHQDSNPEADINWRFNDTWAYDYNTNTWENMTITTYPLNYQFVSVVYSLGSDKVIAFGGSTDRDFYDDPTGGRYHGETWSYDYNTNTWSNITPATSPSPRIGQKMAYDSENDLIILFGGFTHLQTTEIDHETWAYDYNTLNWTQLNPDGNLERRAYSMAYDSESEKTVIFGGNTGDAPNTFFDDTWVFDYDFNNWTKMPKPEIPEDTPMFIIPVIASLSFLALLTIIRRKSR